MVGTKISETMKTTRYILALLGATALFTGCIEENFEETMKVNKGDQIVFGALAGFENNAHETRTIYTGEYYYINANGEVSETKKNDSDRKFEYVHWEKGDKVLIHCDQGNQTAHYNVASGNSTGAALERMQLQGVENNAIQWNDITTNNHEFYAVYPSPYQFSSPVDDSGLLAASGYNERIKISDGVLECYLPSTQAPASISVENGVTIAKPNMDYAYMIARNTVMANPDGQVPTSVDLNFRPVVTALEVTMNFPTFSEGHIYEQNGQKFEVTGYSDIYISNVQISSRDRSPIVGSFIMDLNNYEHNEDTDGYPTVKYDTNSIENDAVSVQMWDTEGKPTKISKGGSLKFTVFLLPTVIEDNLTITVLADGQFKQADLNIKVEAHKKQYVTDIVLPAVPTAEGVQIQAQGSNWVSQLDPATYLGGLSIPATANSFSYNYGRSSNTLGDNATSVNNNYMTQTLSFDNQWNLGVRCFELVSDRCGTNSSGGEDNGTGNLGSQNLRCNNQSLGLTVKDAFDRIVDKVLATPGEFAMIVMTYQPRGGGMADRNPQYYMDVLKEFYDNYKHEDSGRTLESLTCIYQPGLRVGDLKDTPIMIVARPSQEGEDDPTAVSEAQASGYNILTVMGWGSLVDKWYKRGYNTQLYKGSSSSTGGYGNKVDLLYTKLEAMEDYIYGTNGNGTNDFPKDENGVEKSRPVKGSPRFDYTSDQGFKVWAQEWRRVYNRDDYMTYTSGWIIQTTHYVRWFESFSEKKADITDCLVKSIASANNMNMVYFNSLDGFYILTDNDDSYSYYWRGNMGDIGGYADDINEWFYPVLQKYSAADVTGPLGVIIMDRVSNVQDSAGQLLPQTIIQNNFMFNVPKDPGYVKP